MQTVGRAPSKVLARKFVNDTLLKETLMNRSIKLLSVMTLCMAFAANAHAVYSSSLAADFTDWCTAKQGQPATVCTCALDRAAQQIPATAMASFLAAPAGAATATVSSGVGLNAVQIVTACASNASPAAGAAIGAASAYGAGLLGK